MKEITTLPEDFEPSEMFLPVYRPFDTKLEGDKEKNYLLLEDYSMILSDGKRYYEITAKAGYCYDGFSIPKIFRIFHKKHEGAIAVAMFHDLDFQTHYLNAVGKSDWMFILGLKLRKYSWFFRNMIWGFLRCGSWIAYPKDDEYIIAHRKWLHIEEVPAEAMIAAV